MLPLVDNLNTSNVINKQAVVRHIEDDDRNLNTSNVINKLNDL